VIRTNEGALDRLIRIVVAAVLGYEGWVTRPGTTSVVLLVIAAIAALTAIVGWSMPYALLGISTNKKRS